MESPSAIIGVVMLHVLNGDSTRFSLERSTVGGQFTVWADALHDGPVPAGLSDEDLLMPCHEYCGLGHSEMWATVQVMPDDRFKPGPDGRVSCAQR